MTPCESLKALLSSADLPAAKVVRALAIAGSTTALDIVKSTGLARSTVSIALAELREAQLVIDADTRTNGMGRPTLLHSLTPKFGRCAGVLLGLDEIRIAISDMTHTVLSDRSVAVRRDYDPPTALAVIRANLGAQCRALGLPVEELLGVGFAVSAPVSEQGVVLAGSILPTWGGVAVGKVFGPGLGCPIHADNESHCGALAEMTWGAALGESDFVMIKFDLGIGGAIVSGGQLQRGLNGGAAEFGHLTLQPGGALCRCGNRGCLETLAGAAHLLAGAGADLTLPELVANAAAGEVSAGRLVAEAAEAAGWGIGLIATALNPPLFVITGGLAQAGDLFLEPMKRSFERHTLCKPSMLPAEQRTRFVPGSFLANDTVLGAIALVLHQQSRVA